MQQVILPDGFLFGTDNAKVAIKKKLLSEFNLHPLIRLPHSVFGTLIHQLQQIFYSLIKTKPTEETWFYRLDMPEGYKTSQKQKPMQIEHFQPIFDWWNNREEITIDEFDKSKILFAGYIDRNYNIDLCGFPHEEEEILAPKENLYNNIKKNVQV